MTNNSQPPPRRSGRKRTATKKVQESNESARASRPPVDHRTPRRPTANPSGLLDSSVTAPPSSPPTRRQSVGLAQTVSAIVEFVEHNSKHISGASDSRMSPTPPPVVEPSPDGSAEASSAVAGKRRRSIDHITKATQAKGRPRSRSGDLNWADIQMPAYKSPPAVFNLVAPQSPAQTSPLRPMTEAVGSCSEDDSMSPQPVDPVWLKRHRKVGPAGLQSPSSASGNSDPDAPLPCPPVMSPRISRTAFHILDDASSESSHAASSYSSPEQNATVTNEQPNHPNSPLRQSFEGKAEPAMKHSTPESSRSGADSLSSSSDESEICTKSLPEEALESNDETETMPKSVSVIAPPETNKSKHEVGCNGQKMKIVLQADEPESNLSKSILEPNENVRKNGLADISSDANVEEQTQTNLTIPGLNNEKETIITSTAKSDDDAKSGADKESVNIQKPDTPNQDMLQVISAEVWDAPSAQTPVSHVNIEDVFEFLSGNLHCWINPPGEFLAKFAPPILDEHEASKWENDTKEALGERRVMVWNNRIQKVLPFANSPTIPGLLQYLREFPDCDVLSLKNVQHLSRVPRFSHIETERTAQQVKKPPEKSLIAVKLSTSATSEERCNTVVDEMPLRVRDTGADLTKRPDQLKTCAIDSTVAELIHVEEEIIDENSSTDVMFSKKLKRKQAPNQHEEKELNIKRHKPDTNIQSNPSCIQQENEHTPIDTPLFKEQPTCDVVIHRTPELTDVSLDSIKQPGQKPKVILKLRLKPGIEKPNPVPLVLRRRRPSNEDSQMCDNVDRASSTTGKIRPYFEPQLGKRLASIVMHKVIFRLRQYGLDDKDLQAPGQPEIWNVMTNQKVRPQRAPSNGKELLSYLLRSDRYELYYGQDILREIAKRDSVEFVPISEMAPAGLISFWNRKRRVMESHDIVKGEQRTVGRVLRCHKNLTMYQGQDYMRNGIELKTLTKAARRYDRQGLGIVPRHYALVYRGQEVTKIIENGWKPIVINVDRFQAANAVLWDLRKNCLHIIDENSCPENIPVSEFLANQKGDYELYCGQDLDRTATVELMMWFEVLKWGPGCMSDDMVAHLSGVSTAKKSLETSVREVTVLSRHELAKNRRRQLKNTNERLTSSDDEYDSELERDGQILKDLFGGDIISDVTKSKESANAQSKPKKSAIALKSKESADPEKPKDCSSAHDKSKESANAQIKSKEKQAKLKQLKDRTADRVDIPMEDYLGFCLSSKRSDELRRLHPNDHVIVRHKRSNTTLTVVQSPKMKELRRFFTENPDYDIYDRYLYPINIESCESSLVVGASDMYLRAQLSSQRLANKLQSVVTDILKRTRIGDDLEKIRSEIEEELAVCDDFEVALRDLRDGSFVPLACKLLDLLESLDVFNFFTDKKDEFLIGPPDLLSIRGYLEIGDMFLVHDVLEEFRRVSAANIQYMYPGKVTYEEAVSVFLDGEQNLTYFFDSNLKHVRRDRSVFRVRQLCDRACETMELAKSLVGGLGLNQKKKRSIQEGENPDNSEQSWISEKAEIQVENSNQVTGLMFERNPFMNSRDADGNSIMSKNMSNRVLGFIIDYSSAAVNRVGRREHWKVDSNCHLCVKPVENPYTNALVCANRLFSDCKRIVCRTCLQSQSRIAMDLFNFKRIRNSGNWYCVHCTNFCKRTKRVCSKSDEPEQPVIYRKVDYSLDFTFVGCSDDDFVTARFSRLGNDNKYESFNELQQIEGTLVSMDNLLKWCCSLTLKTGIYRVRIEINEKPLLEQMLYVFPQEQAKNDEEPKELVLGKRFIDQARTHQNGSLSSLAVHWEAGECMGSNPAVSLRCTPIRECSRTEGYNWAWSKRHSLMRFKPKITGEIPAQSPTIASTNHIPNLPEADEVTGVESPTNLFKDLLSNKLSYKEYQSAVSAKRYDHMMKHSKWGLVVARSKIHGSGLFTISGYGTGDFIVEYAGDLIRSPLADVREPRYVAQGLGTYMFRVNDEYVVDATVKSNRSRFVNHCCDPNMSSEVINVRGRDLIILKASRPIPPFTELTFDYMLPIEDKKLRCQCRGMGCTGIMN